MKERTRSPYEQEIESIIKINIIQDSYLPFIQSHTWMKTNIIQ